MRGFLGGTSGKESACQCRRHRCDPVHPPSCPYPPKRSPSPDDFTGEFCQIYKEELLLLHKLFLKIEEERAFPTRIPPQLEKNHVGPPSSQDEALSRYSVSREVPR